VSRAHFITHRHYDIPANDRESIARDIEGAGNLIAALLWNHTQEVGLIPNDSHTRSEIHLADEADAA
jgi:hypothetical protein